VFVKLATDQKLEVYLEQYKVAPVFADILNKLAFESLDEAFKASIVYKYSVVLC
jgi:hypothetical protein